MVYKQLKGYTGEYERIKNVCDNFITGIFDIFFVLGKAAKKGMKKSNIHLIS